MNSVELTNRDIASYTASLLREALKRNIDNCIPPVFDCHADMRDLMILIIPKGTLH
jgi:hypothetical protein